MNFEPLTVRFVTSTFLVDRVELRPFLDDLELCFSKVLLQKQ